MATADDPMFENLKTRVAALGLELFIDSDGDLYFANLKTGRMAGVCMNREDAEQLATDLEAKHRVLGRHTRSDERYH